MEAQVKEVKFIIGSDTELWFKQNLSVLDRRGFDEFLAMRLKGWSEAVHRM